MHLHYTELHYNTVIMRYITYNFIILQYIQYYIALKYNIALLYSTKVLTQLYTALQNSHNTELHYSTHPLLH